MAVPSARRNAFVSAVRRSGLPWGSFLDGIRPHCLRLQRRRPFAIARGPGRSRDRYPAEYLFPALSSAKRPPSGCAPAGYSLDVRAPSPGCSGHRKKKDRRPIRGAIQRPPTRILVGETEPSRSCSGLLVALDPFVEPARNACGPPSNRWPRTQECPRLV